MTHCQCQSGLVLAMSPPIRKCNKVREILSFTPLPGEALLDWATGSQLSLLCIRFPTADQYDFTMDWVCLTVLLMPTQRECRCGLQTFWDKVNLRKTFLTEKKYLSFSKYVHYEAIHNLMWKNMLNIDNTVTAYKLTIVWLFSKIH